MWTDIDGDGDPDLLVANLGTHAHDLVCRNNGGGTFTRLTHSLLETTDHWSFHYLSADLDNDGDIDVVSAANTTRIYLNDGAGNFSLSQDLARSHSKSAPLQCSIQQNNSIFSQRANRFCLLTKLSSPDLDPDLSNTQMTSMTHRAWRLPKAIRPRQHHHPCQQAAGGAG